MIIRFRGRNEVRVRGIGVGKGVGRLKVSGDA